MIRRATKITIEIFAGTLTAIVVALGVLGWRLSSGPIVLDYFSPYVERALAPASGEYRIRIGTTIAKWGGWKKPVVVHVRDIKVTRRDGAPVARVPEAIVSFRARALLRGLVAPTAIEVRRPSLLLERDGSGRFALGVRGPGKEKGKDKDKDKDKPGSTLPGAYLASLLSDKGAGPLSYLSAIRITGANLTIRDRHLGLEWYAPAARLLLARDAGGVRMSADLTVKIRERQVQFKAIGLYSRAARSAEIVLTFSGLQPGLFAQSGGKLVSLDAINAVRIPLDGKIFLSLDERGRLGPVKFEIKGGAGSIVLPPPARQSLQVRTLALRGQIGEDFKTLAIESLAVDFGGPVLEARGTLAGLGGRAKLRVSASIRNMPARQLGAYWPAGLDDGGRRWVLANIRQGFVSEVEARLKMSFGGGLEPRIDEIKGALVFRGLSVSYVKGLPPVLGVSGSATFTADGFDFKIDSGRLGKLLLDRTRVRIVGLSSDDLVHQRVIVDGGLKGRLSEAMRIIDLPPLGYASKVGISPGATTGQANIRLRIELPMIDALTLDEVDVTASAKISRFAWKKGLFGLDLTGGELVLGVDKNQMSVKGRIRVGKKFARIAWIEKFADKPKFRRRITIEGLADKAAREAFGLALGQFVDGPLKVRVQLTKFSFGAEKIDAHFDLKQAAMHIPFIGWRKPAGVAGTARLTASMHRGRVRSIPKISLEAAGLKISGSASLSKDGKKLTQLNLDQVRHARTDVALTVRAREDGGYNLTINGASLDGAKLFESDRDPKDGKPAAKPQRNLAMRMDVRRIYFSAKRYLGNVRGRAARIGGRWTVIHFDADTAPGKKLRVRFAQRGPGRAMAIYANDAGATLRALNIMDNVQGGALDIRGAIVGKSGERFVGRITIRKYRLVGAPILKRIAQLGSLEGLLGAFDNDKGVLFKEFVAPFEYRKGRIRVRNGRAIGSQIGVTFDGTLDLTKQRIEMDGTVVPNYTLNSILGKVPLIGEIIVGGKNSGIIATAFTAEGPLKKPKLEVHSLSVLTPAFLRGLWRKFGKDKRPDKAENPPKPRGR
ncbi:MAG: YhdP family protein [Alphaproteobacteria bacterium]